MGVQKPLRQMSPSTIFDCPECHSSRAGVTRDRPPKVRCAECGCLYSIATLPATTQEAQHPAPQTKNQRLAFPSGAQERADKHAQGTNVQAVSRPYGGIITEAHEKLFAQGP